MKRRVDAKTEIWGFLYIYIGKGLAKPLIEFMIVIFYKISEFMQKRINYNALFPKCVGSGLQKVT